MTSEPDDDGDDEFGFLPEEFEEELDRLAAQLPPPRRLPDDLHELFLVIRGAMHFRRDFDPAEPPTPFCRFEAFDVQLGGMGMVIEAHDPQLKRKVAIKLWCRSGPEASAALLAEAQTLAQLSHPNVVTVHETGHWNDRVLSPCVHRPFESVVTHDAPSPSIVQHMSAFQTGASGPVHLQ